MVENSEWKLDDFQKKVDDLKTKAKDLPQHQAAKENLEKAKTDAVKVYDSAMAVLKKVCDDAMTKAPRDPKE